MTRNKTKRMTKRIIESLPGPPEESSTSNIEYSVAQESNLCLAVYKNGSRSWRFKQKFKGKRLFITIGSYPLFTLDDAIEKTRTFKRQIADGIDPRTANEPEERSITFQTFVEQEFLPYAQKHYKTYSNQKHMLDKRILREFGSYPVSEITKRQIALFHQRVCDETSGTTGNRYLSLLSAIFKFGQDFSAVVNTNPCIGVRKAKESQARTKFLYPEEFKKFIQILSTKLDTPQGQALLLLCALGVRKMEALKLRFSDISIADRQALIRDPKNGESRYVALNSIAVELLQRIIDERGSKSEWVFPGATSSATHMKDVRKTFATICREAGIEKSTRNNPDGLRIHDLRRGLASQLLASNIDIITIRDHLGHKSLKSTQIYTRTTTTALAKSSEIASQKIKEAMNE